jgi:hypothetical protein
LEASNSNNIELILNSITDFSFEFDFEEVKKHMVLEEVSNEELTKLGKEKINENFSKNVFKIKLPNGNLIDAESIYKHSLEKNIKEPVLFINPDHKYVRWIIKKDFTTNQLKNKIRNHLKLDKNIDFNELQKSLLKEDIQQQEIVGYINELPIKTTEYMTEGKFIIQSSCSKKYGRKLVFETIQELKIEKDIFVKSKVKQDIKYIRYYFMFVFAVSILWFLSKQTQIFEDWFISVTGFVLFIIPLVVMRLINHSIFDSLLFRKKAEKKYENDYYKKLSIE